MFIRPQGYTQQLILWRTLNVKQKLLITGKLPREFLSYYLQNEDFN